MTKQFKLAVILEGDGKGAVSATRATREELQKLDEQKRRSTQGFTQLTASSKHMGNELLRLRGLVGGVGGALAGAFSVGAVLRSTIEQERAVTQLNAAIRSTGNASGLTSQQLQGMAGRLQKVSTFSDQAIIGSQALLLTFTQVGRETFPRAQKAILDVSTAMGTDLKSATLQVGKALNDPIRGVSALAESGIQFTERQKGVIRSLTETGQVAQAQAIILAELERQFGGSAVAAANTLGGSLTQLKNVMGDLMEGRGGSLTGATASVKELTATLNSPEVVQGFDGITSGIVRFVGWTAEGVAKASSVFTAFSKEVGETAAEIVLNLNGMSGDLTQSLTFAERNVRQLQTALSNRAALGVDTTELEQKLAAAEARVAGFRDQLRQASLSRIGAAGADAQLGLQGIVGGGANAGVPLFFRDAANGAEQFAGANRLAAQSVHALQAALNPQITALQSQLDLMRQGLTAQEAQTRLRLQAEGLTQREIQQIMGLTAQIDALGAARAKSQADAAQQAAEQARAASRQQSMNAEIALLARQNLLILEGRSLEEARFIAQYEVADEATRSLMAQQRAQEKLLEQGPAVRSLAEDLKALDVGRAPIEGFDEMSRSIIAAVESLNLLTDSQAAFSELRKQYADDEDGLAKLTAKHMGNQIALYGDLVGSAKGFFNEGTSGYKALAAAEEVFRAREIALALGNFVKKSGLLAADVAQTVAAEGTKQTVLGSTAMAQAIAALPPPFNVPLITATAAALAAFGVVTAFGGGGGGGGSAPLPPASRGVGTVLGDPEEASESILRGLDALRDVGEQGILVNQQMLATLRSIERGLNPLGEAVALASRQSGLPLLPERIEFAGNPTLGQLAGGDVGAQFQTVIRGLFFNGTSARLTQQTLTEQLSASLRSGISDTFSEINAAAASAAANITGAGESFFRNAFGNQTLPSTVIDLAGLDQEEAAQRFRDFINTAADTAVAAVAPLAVELQQFGEGAFESLIRISTQADVLRDASDALGISLRSVIPPQSELDKLLRFVELPAEQVTRIANELSLAAGGLDEFAGNVAGFFDFALTDAELLARQGEQLGSIFATVGGVLPDTRDEVRAFVSALDLTTEAGRNGFTALTQASSLLDDYFTQLEELEQERADFGRDLQRELEQLTLTPDAFGLAELERGIADLRQQAEELGFDDTVIQGLIDARRAAFEADLALQQMNATLQRTSFLDQLQREIDQLTLSPEDFALRELERGIADTRRRAEELGLSLDNELVRGLEDARRAAFAADQSLQRMNATLTRSRAVAQTAESALQSAFGRESSALQSLIGELDSIVDALGAARRQIGGNADPLGSFAASLTRGLQGDRAALGALPGLAQTAADALLASATGEVELQRGLAQIRRGLLDAEVSASAQRTVAELQLDSLEMQLTALGIINETMLSVDEAVRQLLTAREAALIAEAQSGLTREQITQLNTLRAELTGVSATSGQRLVDAIGGVTALLGGQATGPQLIDALDNIFSPAALAQAFDALDVNFDGVVDLSEVVRSISALDGTTLGVQAAVDLMRLTGEQIAAAQSGLTREQIAQLDRLRADLTGVSAMSGQRLVDAIGGVTALLGGQATGPQLIDALDNIFSPAALAQAFDALDINFDGVVDISEVVRSISALDGTTLGVGDAVSRLLSESAASAIARQQAEQAAALQALQTQTNALTQGQTSSVTGAINANSVAERNELVRLTQELVRLTAAQFDQGRSAAAWLNFIGNGMLNQGGGVVGGNVAILAVNSDLTLKNTRNILHALNDGFNGGGYTNKQTFATGAAFTNGIVSRPTLFNIGEMGEAGPEAIMPLANIGGQLGVRAAVGGGESMQAMADELRALRAEVARLREDNHSHALSTVRVLSSTEQRLQRMSDGDALRVRETA